MASEQRGSSRLSPSRDRREARLADSLEVGSGPRPGQTWEGEKVALNSRFIGQTQVSPLRPK